jgi:hypothetical protein
MGVLYLKKNTIINIGLCLIIVAVFLIWYFNISLTSLPTTFSNMFEKELSELDYEKIQNLEIEKFYSGDQNIIIKDKVEIESILTNLLNNDLRIYNGGRLDMSGSEYQLSINLYGSRYRYVVGEKYIMSPKADLYKVLDDENSVFEYLESLYEEK